VLNKLVRDKYPPETVEAARRFKGSAEKISGFRPSVNSKISEIFTKDAEKAIDILERIHTNNYRRVDDIQMYVINIHAMKSALANIGETELSTAASRLEEAGRGQNIILISEETPAFLTALRMVVEKIRSNKDDAVNETDDISHDDLVYLHEKLAVIWEACTKYDKKTAKDTLAQLRQKAWPRAVGELLSDIAEQMLHSEFAKAAKLAEDGRNNSESLLTKSP
jgi:HPt (histidine-containing phosphotransfer) domain-containing protein